MIEYKFKKNLIEIINKYAPDAKIYLFGSRSRKDNKPGSDIDLALDSNIKLKINILMNIKSDIESTNIPFFVDIVDINNVDDVMKNEILKDGVLWKN